MKDLQIQVLEWPIWDLFDLLTEMASRGFVEAVGATSLQQLLLFVYVATFVLSLKLSNQPVQEEKKTFDL